MGTTSTGGCARGIPLMERSSADPTVRRTQGIEVDPASPRPRAAHSPCQHQTVILSTSRRNQCLPAASCQRRKGGTIRLIYSEALFDRTGRKATGMRLPAGRRLAHDILVPDGGRQPPVHHAWFRTYRYIERRSNGAERYSGRLHGNFTGYPFKERGSFACNDARLSDIWTWAGAPALCAGKLLRLPIREMQLWRHAHPVPRLPIRGGDDRLMRNAIDWYDSRGFPRG